MTMRSTTSKVPPYSVYSEKVVLGSILRDPSLVTTMRKILTSGKAFFRSEHEALYDLLIEIKPTRKGPDTLELIDSLVARDLPGDAGSEQRLTELAEAGQDVEGAAEHARVVLEKARMRHLIDTVSDILHDAYHSEEGFEVVLGRARERLEALARYKP